MNLKALYYINKSDLVLTTQSKPTDYNTIAGQLWIWDRPTSEFGGRCLGYFNYKKGFTGTDSIKDCIK